MNQSSLGSLYHAERSVCANTRVSEKELGSLELHRRFQCGLTQRVDVGSETSTQEPDSAKKWEDHPVGHGVPLKDVAGEILLYEDSSGSKAEGRGLLQLLGKDMVVPELLRGTRSER